MPDLTSVHARLLQALREEIGDRALLKDARTSGTEEVILRLDATGRGRRLDLHLLLIAPAPLFWLTPAPRKPDSASSGFADWLQRHILGMCVTCVSSGQSGRILRLDLSPSVSRTAGPRSESRTAGSRSDRGAESPAATMALVLDPIPSACRLLILDADGMVAQRFPPTIHARPTGRGAPGERYAEPHAARDEPWQREMGVPTRPGAQGTSPGELWVWQIPTRVSGAGQESGPLLAPAPFESSAAAGGVTSSGPHAPLEAARRAGEAWIEGARRNECARVIQRTLRANRKHFANLERRLQVELDEGERDRDLRRQAEALLANAGRIRKGAREVLLDDPSAPGEKIRVMLDPAQSFSKNAARLFQRAARLERALPIRRKKREQLRTLLVRIDAWLDVLAAPGAIEAWRAAWEEARVLGSGMEPGLRRRWKNAVDEWRSALDGLRMPVDREGYASRYASRAAARGPGARERSRDEDALSDSASAALPNAAGINPRRYELPGAWVVLVGRSNRENDILTHHVARPEDLWFHARGVAGSHVVLRRAGRRESPDRETIERAAAIAAYYSKARTSGLAPIVYTEKRYVRKPRKAAPGLALCMREKVIMVKPGLPQG